MLRYSFLLFLIPFLCTSCSIEKRLYRDGFYIGKKHTPVAVVQSTQQPEMVESERVHSMHSDATSAATADTIQQVLQGTETLTIDTVKRKWFRKTDRDTIPAEEEPVRIETPSKRWRFAAEAALTSFLGLTLGFLLLVIAFNEWLAIILGVLLVATILLFIFLSLRAHRRYKAQEGDAGKQTVWGIVGRFLLYALALTLGAIIFNGFVLWSIKDL